MPTSPPKIGDAVKMKNWDVTVANGEKPGKSLGGNFGNVKPVGECLVVEVSLKNTGGQNFGFTDGDFDLRTPTNAKITTKSDFSLTGYNSSRGGNTASQIPPGATVKYYVVFDVADTNGLLLEFQGNAQKIALQ